MSVSSSQTASEKQITHDSKGHVLTNSNVWSPGSKWIVYDTRSDAAGDSFNGSLIEIVNVETSEVRRLYESKNGAYCGVVTFKPTGHEVVFIHGPENPTPDWQYNAYHRQGVLVDTENLGHAAHLDARDVTPPFTPGALRGGTHVHIFSPDGKWVSFTYEDHVLARFADEADGHENNLRNVGISVPMKSVTVKKDHPRNHDGSYFTVLVTRTTANPKPGSDEIKKAYEESWVGKDGYTRKDGKRQHRALAFQGDVIGADGKPFTEVFVVDLPEDVTKASPDGPLEGTERLRPRPPFGAVQRRLTFTANRKYPGIQGVRHWLKSSPDGSQIAFLMRDDNGISQLWTISPNGGPPHQLTHNSSDIASAFTWSPDGKLIAHVMDNSVCITDTLTGETTRLTQRSDDDSAPRPQACVFSPDGRKIAYVRRVRQGDAWYNQIFVTMLKKSPPAP